MARKGKGLVGGIVGGNVGFSISLYISIYELVVSILTSILISIWVLPMFLLTIYEMVKGERAKKRGRRKKGFVGFFLGFL